MPPSESRANLYELTGPEQFVVWSSRHYLWSALRGTAAPDFVYEAFENAGIDFLYYSLDRVLVCLLAAPIRAVTVHDVRCHCLAQHEQALLSALRRLQRNDDAGFSAAMSAIMLPSAISMAQPAMKLLAAGMMRLKAGQLSWLGAGGQAPDETVREHDRRCHNRTIN
jgi:hypothetical protein